MRKAIVDEAIAKGGKLARKAELSAAIDRSLAAGGQLLEVLLAVGIDPDVVVAAASHVSGLPPAPRLLINHPQIPDDLDATGIRDAGGVPVGTVQGRLWIAFADPDAAHAAVFSDDVVVCLALPDDLGMARVAFDAKHPPDDDASTITIAAVTPEALRQQLAAKKPPPAPPSQWDEPTRQVEPLTKPASRPPTAPTKKPVLTAPTKLNQPPVEMSDEDLFDAPQVTADRPALETSVDPAGATRVQKMPLPATELPEALMTTDPASSNASPESDPARLRLLRLAQLGKLKQFQFVRPLGSGGMATVYLATHRGANVAVKVLEPHLVNDALALERFRREVRALQSLDHPHITTTIDAGDADASAADNVCWLCTPYLDGGTLAELKARTGAMPLGMALPIVGAILEGVAHAHERGVLHRDLKPQNVLLSTAGDVQISDFGLARIAGDAPLTRIGVRAGTPAYMAPEQAQGAELDERADVFSAGVILLELISDVHPFARATPQETMKAIVNVDVDVDTGVALVDVVLRGMLARGREQRTASARTVLAQLAPILDHSAAVEAVVARALADPQSAVDSAVETIGPHLGMLAGIPPTRADPDLSSASTAVEPTLPQASSPTLYPHTITNLAIPVLPLAQVDVATEMVRTANDVPDDNGAVRNNAAIVAVVVVGVVAAIAVVAAIVHFVF